MSRMISRDPFARQELHRETVKVWPGSGNCAWCGSVRPSKTGGGYLYRYSTEYDAGRAFKHPGLFCSKSCHDAYHIQGV